MLHVCMCVCVTVLYTCSNEDSQGGIWLLSPLTDLFKDQETFFSIFGYEGTLGLYAACV